MPHFAATFLITLFSSKALLTTATPIATVSNGATYHGIYEHKIEGFVGIRYAHDTGGSNRFKTPQPYTPSPDSEIDASDPGLPCPQDKDKPSEAKFQLQLTAITAISEDCLRLNVWRPNGTRAGAELPILVHLYGGAYYCVVEAV